MHHFMQHRVLHLSPRMPSGVPAADPYLLGMIVFGIDNQLAESALHSA